MTDHSSDAAPGSEVTASVADLREKNRRLRDALRSSDARFHSTVERSVDGVIVLDSADVVRFANRSALALFARARADLLGSDFGFPVVAGERTEIDVLRPGGQTLVGEMRATPTVWEEDDNSVLVLIRDVTAQRAGEDRERALIREHLAREEAEAAAHRAEVLDRAGRLMAGTMELDELLRGLADVIVEEIGDVCVIDIDDESGPLRRLVAARRDDPRRALLKGLEDRPVSLELNEAEGRVFRTGESELVEEVTQDWLNEVSEQAAIMSPLRQMEPCSLMMITLLAGSASWGVVTILSCTRGRHFEQNDLLLAEELMRRSAIAMENARLFRLARESSRAKSDFLAVVSHELRTPLSAAIGYAGLLTEGVGGELNDRQREFVESIRQSAEHLERLIDQIITFARLEGGHERLELEEVDPSDVLEDVAILIRPLAEKRGLALTLDDRWDGEWITTDKRKLSQVLVNLATNAVKYTVEGAVAIAVEADENQVVFRISDTGRGIAGDKFEEIFEPFRQLEDPSTRSEGGAGIGLSVVKNLTRLLGGEVEVESRPNVGSTFSLSLPRQPR